MSNPEYLHHKSQLPPKPDPNTGEPRPPRAPIDAGTPEATADAMSERRKPEPPPGRGPTLEWNVITRRYAALLAVAGFVAIVGLYSLVRQDIGWMSIWWLWLIPLIIAPLMGLSSLNNSCAAGADWFAMGKAFVDTYDLSSVKVMAQTAHRQLELKDSSGRRTSIKLMEIQANRDLWDLVYNGILHSVAQGGADTNKLARRALRLPDNTRNSSTDDA